jgi:L-seryl-tRNA(Ser) seleniumtransferase
VLGRRDPIDAMRQNPLARALRVDKLTLAALDATLDLLLEPGRADEIPIVSGLRASQDVLLARAACLEGLLRGVLPGALALEIAVSDGAVGGGSLPELGLVGRAVVVRGPGLAALAEGLRSAPVPVVARLFEDGLWLDVRTLDDEELPLVAAAFAHALR